jgi:hypothetical protein
MKIFISWSGRQTKLIANCLSEFITKVLELDSKPFLSFEILKGETWYQRIIGNLRKADFGIILLTPKNTLSTWINFEAGALKISAIKVCPLLFGIRPTELPAPLNQFQAAEFSQQDMFMLLESINKMNRTKKLKKNQIKKNFDKYWTDFQKK